MTKRASKTLEFITENATYSGDDCIEWPFHTNKVHGYGYLGVGVARKMWRAHRLMCVIIHGEPPSPQHHAAHSCGNRKCISPRHLSWKTSSENMRDKRVHGTTPVNTWGRRGKLNHEQVAEIRDLQGKKSQLEIAADFGISPHQVGNIHSGKSRAA